MPHWQLEDDPYTPQRALQELDYWWGALYDIWLSGAGFAACLRGGPRGELLIAATAEGLDAAMRADQELAGDSAARAAVRGYAARGVDVVWAGFWQAVVNEDIGHTIVSRDGLPELLGRLRDLDAAGVLPGSAV